MAYGWPYSRVRGAAWFAFKSNRNFCAKAASRPAKTAWASAAESPSKRGKKPARPAFVIVRKDAFVDDLGHREVPDRSARQLDRIEFFAELQPDNRRSWRSIDTKSGGRASDLLLKVNVGRRFGRASG